MEEEKLQIDQLDNYSLPMFQWPEWKSKSVVLLSTISIVFSLCGKGMIVYYIKTYAPKDRPINKMFLIDQVS